MHLSKNNKSKGGTKSSAKPDGLTARHNARASHKRRAVILITADEKFEHPAVDGVIPGPKVRTKQGIPVDLALVRRSLMARGHRGGWSTNAPRKAMLHYQSGSVLGNVTAQLGAIIFQLDQFEGYADWAAVADAYRLLKVRVKFIPQVNFHSLTTKATVTTGVMPLLYVVEDYDDANAPSAITDVLQYNTLHSGSPFREFEVLLKPKVSSAVYAGGVSNGYAQEDSDIWIDIANNDVEHYGLKYGVTGTNASQTTYPSWYVVVDGWFEFRQWR